jgi:acetylornithine deacetylase
VSPEVGDLAEAVPAAAEARAGEIVELAAELIRIPSTNPTLAEDPNEVLGGEGRCSELAAGVMREMGLDVELVEVAEGRANAVGLRRGNGGGRSLAFNGHVDTVPADPATWSVDPWGGSVAEGRLWGRGATDMKGAVAAMVKAVQVLDDLGAELRGDVSVHVVAGEEMFDPEGTASVLEASHVADACIVGEPTREQGVGNAVQVISAPVLWMRVTLRGRSAHSSLRYRWLYPGGTPHLGVNAIEKGVELVRSLQELERQWGMLKVHPLFPPGKFVLHPGIFQGAPEGVAIPALPAERCVVEYTIWHHPDETAGEVQHEIAAWIERWAAFDPWLSDHPPELEWLGVYPNFAVDPGHELVKVVREAHEAVAGAEAAITSMPAACDATFYSQRGIPAVVYGPGDLAEAHTIDEGIDTEQLVQAAKVYALSALRWCG